MESHQDVSSVEDELDRADIKPWWESATFHCLRLLFCTSMVLMYLVDAQDFDVKCFPKHLNSSIPDSLFDYVDRVCYFTLPPQIRYPGCSGLVCSVVAFLLGATWTANREVKDAALSITKIESVFMRMEITEKDVENFIEGNLTELSWEKQVKIKYAFEWLYTNIKFVRATLPNIYITANVLRFACFCAVIPFLWTDVIVNKENIDFTHFDCVYEFNNTAVHLDCVTDIGLKWFMGSLIATVFAATAISCSLYGMVESSTSCITRSYQCEPTGREKDLLKCRNLVFLRSFCNSGTTLSHATKKLMDHVALHQVQEREFVTCCQSMRNALNPNQGTAQTRFREHSRMEQDRL